MREAATAGYMDILNEHAVNIEETPLGAFGYNETEEGVDGAGEEGDDEVEEIGGSVFTASKRRGR